MSARSIDQRDVSELASAELIAEPRHKLEAAGASTDDDDAMKVGALAHHCTDARLSSIDGGQGRHVKNAPHGRGLSKNVRGLGGTEENRTDRDAASGADPEEVVGDGA